MIAVKTVLDIWGWEQQRTNLGATAPLPSPMKEGEGVLPCLKNFLRAPAFPLNGNRCSGSKLSFPKNII